MSRDSALSILSSLTHLRFPFRFPAPIRKLARSYPRKILACGFTLAHPTSARKRRCSNFVRPPLLLYDLRCLQYKTGESDAGCIIEDFVYATWLKIIDKIEIVIIERYL